ncbi:MAG: hypothetical protein RR900_09570 [Ruthenibacterium sp.]
MAQHESTLAYWNAQAIKSESDIDLQLDSFPCANFYNTKPKEHGKHSLSCRMGKNDSGRIWTSADRNNLIATSKNGVTILLGGQDCNSTF